LNWYKTRKPEKSRGKIMWVLKKIFWNNGNNLRSGRSKEVHKHIPRMLRKKKNGWA